MQEEVQGKDWKGTGKEKRCKKEGFMEKRCKEKKEAVQKKVQGKDGEKWLGKKTEVPGKENG